MLPNDVASSIAVLALMHDPDTRVTSPLRDFEFGGTALNNASGGLMQTVWMLDYVGVTVGVTPEGGERIVLFSMGGITDLAIAFDQNMRPAVAYMRSNILYLRWYDSVPAAFVTTSFGLGITSPRMALDDKRVTQIGPRSDMILAYVKNLSVCYRQQRDRFLTERVLRTGLPVGTRLRTIGMGKGLRFQFELVPK